MRAKNVRLMLDKLLKTMHIWSISVTRQFLAAMIVEHSLMMAEREEGDILFIDQVESYIDVARNALQFREEEEDRLRAIAAAVERMEAAYAMWVGELFIR